MSDIQKIDIQDLREDGENGGDLMGYYCKGHVDAHEFSRAANKRSGAFEHYDSRHVAPKDVKHVWWRTVPISGEDGCYSFHNAVPGSRGAFQATVADVISCRRIRRIEHEIAEQRRQYANGFAAGVNWAIGLLSFRHKEAENVILTAWRNGAADRKIKDSF